MGSPAKGKAIGKYTGNGGSAAQKIALGFVPEVIKIVSVEGTVLWTHRGAFKEDSGATPAALTAGIRTLSDQGATPGTGNAGFDTLGFEVSGSDDTVNKTATEYLYIAE